MPSIEANKNPAPRIHVVAGVVVTDDGRVLISQRRQDTHLAGKWEFPGGKLESGESAAMALVRELQEELSITPQIYTPLITIEHQYPEKTILLDVWLINKYNGDVCANEGQNYRWININSLSAVDMPDADIPIISSLMLSNNYLISPEPANYQKKQFFDLMEKNIANLPLSFSKKRLFQLRSKNISQKELRIYAMAAKEICLRHDCLLIINTSPEFADEVGANGVHLTGSKMQDLYLSKTQLPAGLIVGASCHCKEDILAANALNVDFAVISPVMSTASHPGKDGIGWDGFAKIAYNAKFPIFALGGMHPDDVKISKKYGGHGIAAIRGLWSE